MVEYPLKVIFSAGIVFFIPLQGYEKRHGRALGVNHYTAK